MPRRERGNSGVLLLGSKKDQTLKKYLREVRAFLAWTDYWEETTVSIADLDELLVDYFHELYDQGFGPHKAMCCYYGLVMLAPSWKNALPTAKLALKGYQNLFPSVAYPPMKRQLVHLVAAHLLAQDKRDMAVAVLLAFEGLLRIGEVVGLHVSDLVDCLDDRLPLGVEVPGFALRLRRTKTGPEQWAHVDDPFVVRVLRQHVARVHPSKRATARLFPFNAAQLRRAFKKSVHVLGLGFNYVFHSLRHGRATEMFLSRKPLEDVLSAGRWASTKTARHYVQTGRVLLIATQVPDEVARTANQISALLPLLM